MASITRSSAVTGFAVYFLLAAAIHSFGQTEEKDKAEAVIEAHRVAHYLQQTQDIRPLLRKFAVKNFLDGAVRDSLFNVFTFLDEDLRRKLDKKIQSDYYIAASNWFYLAIIYTCANKPKMNAYGGEDIVFPPGVEKLMRGKPILSTWLNDSDEKAPKPKTAEDVRKAVIDIEKVNSIYRRYSKFLKAKPYKQYVAMAKKGLDGGSEFFKPQVSNCGNDRECVGLPRGSRLIIMSVPGFYYVAFTRVNGRMKIIHIFHGAGD